MKDSANELHGAADAAALPEHAAEELPSAERSLSLESAPDRPRRGRILLLSVGVIVLLTAAYLPWSREREAKNRLVAARSALQANDLEAARAQVMACLSLRPGWPEAHRLTARIAEREGAWEEADRHLTAFQESGGAPEDYTLEFAMLRFRQGDVVGPHQYLVALVDKKHPESRVILESLCRGYMSAYRVPEALAASLKLLEMDAENLDGLLANGWALEQFNRFAEAEAKYQVAVKVAPNNWLARMSLGEVLLHFKRPAEALEQFERLNSVTPNHPAVLLGLARCRRGLGEYDEAKKLLGPLLVHFPDEGLVLAEKGQLAFQDGQFAEAERWLRQALKRRPSDRATNYALYQSLQAQGKEAEAKLALARVDQADARMKRMTELAQAIVKQPSAPDQRFEMGLLYFEMGRDPEAVQWLRSALQEEPRHASAHKTLAEYYEKTGQANLAAQHRQMAGPRK